MSKKKSGGWRSSTVGRWFQWGLTKKAPDPDTSAQNIAKAASEAAMETAKEKEKLRLKASAGRRSLISTSGAGVLEPATTNKKKLTGE